MLNSTTEADVAIKAGHRRLINSIQIDWDQDGSFSHPLTNLHPYLMRASFDQVWNGTAPEEIQLIEGYAAAKLDIEVSGNHGGMSLVSQFSPENPWSIFYPDSVLAGSPVYYSIAVVTELGNETFVQLRGRVRDVGVDRETGVVTISCLDYVEHLRDTITLPAYAIDIKYLSQGFKRGGLIDSSSLIDLAARSGGFTAGPRPGLGDYGETILSVPLHGSPLPEKGFLDNDLQIHKTEEWEDQGYSPSEAYRDGPHGYLAANAVPKGYEQYARKSYWIDPEDGTSSLSTGTYVFGCWVHWTEPDLYNTANLIELLYGDGILILRVDGSTGEVFPVTHDKDDVENVGEKKPLSSGWNYVEVGFENDIAIRSRTRVGDDEGSPIEIRSKPLSSSYTALTNLVHVQHVHPMSDVEIAYSPSDDYLQYIHKNITPVGNAQVSKGRNRATHTTRRSVEAWELIKEVAGAEFGAAYFTNDGTFVFLNYEDILNKQTSTELEIGINDIEGLSLRRTLSSVRNHWQVTTSSAHMAHKTVWEYSDSSSPLVDFYGEYYPAELISGTAAGRHEYIVRPDDRMICPNPYSLPIVAPSDKWSSEIPRAGRTPYANGSYVGDSGANLSTEQKWYGDHIRISLWNSLSDDVEYINPDGEYRYRVDGTRVIDDGKTTWTVSHSDSKDKYGVRSIRLSGNYWYQDRFQIETMLQEQIERFAYPIPVTDDISIPGDPRVQLGDVLELTDPYGISPTIYLQILGIKRDMSTGQGLTDTYQVEVIKSTTYGQWDDHKYGIWDQSMIWGE
ncbi:hypothetical protein [Actinopolyspora erythraea]|uniref:hypothetical protein n=1 Tax=Actinopolyspora erythraea TaxID=414996 RepID=UPI000AA78EF1|nr:hypothetical protein [Actinopolyspora erythraea]